MTVIRLGEPSLAQNSDKNGIARTTAYHKGRRPRRLIVYPIYAILFLSGSKREPAQLYFTKGETAYEACTEKKGCHRHLLPLLPLDRPRAGSHSGGYPLSGKSRIPDQAGPSMRETGFLPAGSGSTRDGRKSRSLRPEPRAGGLLLADPPVKYRISSIHHFESL